MERNVMTIHKTFAHEIKQFLPQARKQFLSFIQTHNIGGERFPDFCLNMVKWAVERSDKIFLTLNDDGTLRAFLILGSSSDWNIEYRIEIIAGDEEDYYVLIENAKLFVKQKSGLIITTLCYPSEFLKKVDLKEVWK